MDCSLCLYPFIFFFNTTPTTAIYTYWHTLSLHDALPIYSPHRPRRRQPAPGPRARRASGIAPVGRALRSEEHTSELQSLMRISYAVFCLKKKTQRYHTNSQTYTQETYTIANLS